jgi:hypothetical protein
MKEQSIARESPELAQISIFFDKKHIKIHKAEKICQDLNEGVTINWDDLVTIYA